MSFKDFELNSMDKYLEHYREKYVTKIRRQQKEERVLKERKAHQQNILNIIQTEIQAQLPSALKNFKRGEHNALRELLNSYSIFLNEGTLISVLEHLTMDFSQEGLPLIALLTENQKFKQVVSKELIELVATALTLITENIALLKQNDKSLDYIYVILANSFQLCHAEKFMTVAAVINNNPFLTITKSLVHLYHKLRKSQRTIVREQCLDNLLKGTFDSEQCETQQRVIDILNSALVFKTITIQNIPFMITWIEKIIISNKCDKNVREHTLIVLFRLIQHQAYDPKFPIVGNFLRSNLFQYTLDVLMSPSSSNHEVQSMLLIIYFLSINSSDTQLRAILSARSEQYKRPAKWHSKQIVWEIPQVLVENIQNFDVQITLICLQVISKCFFCGFTQYFQSTDLAKIIGKVLSREYIQQGVQMLANNINDYIGG